jgi:hypothetical protein
MVNASRWTLATDETAMSRDPKKKLDPLTEMLRQQQRIQDLVDPPALRATREAQERIRDMVDPPMLRATREAQERIRDMVDPPALRTMRETMEAIRGYSKSLSDLTFEPNEAATHAAKAFSLDLSNVSSLAAMTTYARSSQLFGFGATVIEAALRQGHLEHQATNAGLAAAGIAKLAARISQPNFEPSVELVTAGIEFLAPSFEDGTANLVAEMASEVFRAVDLDIILPGHAQNFENSERIELATRTANELETFLSNLDPQLLALLNGAREAARSQNPDKTRHVCISLRELLGYALRNLAPDAEVTAWTQDPQYYHDGKPTRAARMQYLYSHVAEPALKKFIAADVRAALELFDLLSNGAHVANLGTTTAALTILMNRAEGVLLLFLRLGSVRQNGV